MKFAIKNGGLLSIYKEWLDSLPMVHKDEPSSMEIGDIALVGAHRVSPLSSRTTERSMSAASIAP